MKRLAMFGSLLCSGVVLADPPSPSERVLVLRVDDYVGDSVVTSGTGRALWSGTSAMLHKRGVAALPGDAASLVRGIEEARSKECTVIAMPEFSQYKESKKELNIGVRIMWLGLDRTERARCEQKQKILIEKGKDPDRGALLLNILEACVTSVYGATATKPRAANAWLIARYDMVYATKADAASEISQRLGDAALSLADTAKGLAAGRNVLIARQYEEGSHLIQRFELYPAGVAVEAHAEIADVEISNRLRARLEDRALEGILEELHARKIVVPEFFAIPASDPLDRIITVVSIVLPKSKLISERGVEGGTGSSSPLLWARLTVSADGTVQEAVALNGEDSPVLQAAKLGGCAPGTRGGQPQEMHVLVALDNWPPDKRD